MKKYKYAYLFTIGTKIVWSAETEESLARRTKIEADLDLIDDFIDADKVGSFIELSTGEFVFQTS